jgi:hypothetical protein
MIIAWCCGFAGKYVSGTDVLVHRSVEERKAKSFRQGETLSASQDRARIVFDCLTANHPATINKESTNENNIGVDRWADARRLRINGKPCS